MQEMFREHHALQCGFCTPGMVMSAIDLVQSHPEGLTEAEIRHGLEGNLCRCTGYHNIVKAVAAAWPLMHGQTVAARRGIRREPCIISNMSNPEPSPRPAKILAEDMEAKALAGGQTFIPVLKQRLNKPSVVVDLAGLNLAGIKRSRAISRSAR